MTNTELHKEICEKLGKIYETKNSDYGDSTHKSYRDYGMVSFVVRMQDKLNRIYNLACKNTDRKIEDEKIEDTLLDLANYAILALIELESDKMNEIIRVGAGLTINQEGGNKGGTTKKNRHI